MVVQLNIKILKSSTATEVRQGVRKDLLQQFIEVYLLVSGLNWNKSQKIASKGSGSSSCKDTVKAAVAVVVMIAVNVSVI